jgi:hypothetical protein
MQDGDSSLFSLIFEFVDVITVGARLNKKLCSSFFHGFRTIFY